ncbi:HAD hydrolase family protein, partial [Lactococcus lactis]
MENYKERKLIAIDLDGTTLQSDGRSISRYTKYIFKQVESLGHIICITTGRLLFVFLEELRTRNTG